MGLVFEIPPSIDSAILILTLGNYNTKLGPVKAVAHQIRNHLASFFVGRLCPMPARAVHKCFAYGGGF